MKAVIVRVVCTMCTSPASTCKGPGPGAKEREAQKANPSTGAAKEQEWFLPSQSVRHCAEQHPAGHPCRAKQLQSNKWRGVACGGERRCKERGKGGRGRRGAERGRRAVTSIASVGCGAVLGKNATHPLELPKTRSSRPASPLRSLAAHLPCWALTWHPMPQRNQ